MLRRCRTPLSEERMAELRSLAQPHLKPGERVLSGAHGLVAPMPSLMLALILVTPLLGLLLSHTLVSSWQLVLTNQCLLAIRVGTFRGNWLRPRGETCSFPWRDMVSLELHRELLLGDSLRFSTGRDKITYHNLQQHDLGDLRARLHAVRPDLFPA
jgi:hypothetical protein